MTKTSGSFADADNESPRRCQHNLEAARSKLMLVEDHDEKPGICPSVSAISSLSLGVELLVAAT